MAIRKDSSSRRAGHWNRFSRKMVMAPSREAPRGVWTIVLGTWGDSCIVLHRDESWT